MFDGHKVTIGVVPVKRAHLSLERAAKEKEKVLKAIGGIEKDRVRLVDIDDIAPSGVAWQLELVDRIKEKLQKEKVDGIFMLHCDFGTEEVVGRLGKALGLPVLLWGPRDEAPDAEGKRAADTQCGIFASSKALQRYGVPFSYIINCPVESDRFMEGFKKFCMTVSVVKSFKSLRIAQIGSRPRPFLSVIYNEDELLNRFGIEVIPVSVPDIVRRTRDMLNENPASLKDAIDDIRERIDTSFTDEQKLRTAAAMKLVLADLIVSNGCTAAALECWTAFPRTLGITPCFVVAEITGMGIPVACETDVNGAVSSIMLQAAALGRTATFFADLTIRHPENDNAELLWHCGPFPYSLKADDSPARLINAVANWRLKGGSITIARFDALSGEYSLFSGEGRGVEGPYTTGTYVWMEVDHWEKWEEKFIFGPYIHHVAGIHGNYARILHEACKYIPGLKSDTVHSFGASL